MNNTGIRIYKSCLEINLIGESKLSIGLLYIDDTAMSPEKDSIIHSNYKNNFHIWSGKFFSFSDKYMRFPETVNNVNNISFLYDYESDDNRKEGLRKLYESLQTWCRDKRIFINNYSPKGNNIDIFDNFWLIY